MNFTPLQSTGRSAQRSPYSGERRDSYAASGAGTGFSGAAYADAGRAYGRAASWRAEGSGASAAGRVRARGGFRAAGAADGRAAAGGSPYRASRAAADGTAVLAADSAAYNGSMPAEGAASSRRRARGVGSGSLIRYATDNVFVRAMYALTTGPLRFAFYAVVAFAVGASLYVPLRGWYIAARSEEVKTDLYQEQSASNAAKQETVDKLLSQEGIKEIARSKLGLVEPGEVSGMVVGLGDEGGSAASDGSGTADGGSASDGANSAAGDGSDGADGADGASAEPWYESVLDRVFFFSLDDVQGLTTVGSGA